MEVHGEQILASGVVNTAPLHILARLVHGSDRLKACAEFKYRPMVFVNLKIEGRDAMRDVVTWTPEKHYPFFRVSDIGRALPWLVPEDKNQLTCDIGCDVGDGVWNAPVDALASHNSANCSAKRLNLGGNSNLVLHDRVGFSDKALCPS